MKIAARRMAKMARIRHDNMATWHRRSAVKKRRRRGETERNGKRAARNRLNGIARLKHIILRRARCVWRIASVPRAVLFLPLIWR